MFIFVWHQYTSILRALRFVSQVQWTNQHLAAEQSCVIDTVGIYWGADCAAVCLQQDVVLGA